MRNLRDRSRGSAAMGWNAAFGTLLAILLGNQAAQAVDYLRDVKPLLEQKCYACHGALKQQAGLRLDTAASIKTGGDSGSAVDLASPGDSLLLAAILGEGGRRMPPENEGTPLKPQEIEVLRAWIAAGAPVPEHEEPQTDPRAWWSYRPIETPPLPEVTDAAWCRNPIDRLVAAVREERHLPPVAEAPKAIWLRRVYLDLIGLPPTRAELHRFLADDSETAYESVVENLLASPHYGERWGRHWMDIWRYSDWYGSRAINEIRYSQRHIWRWRDWIVKSLNRDRGYDEMVREMLAADELSGQESSSDLETLAATGYLGRNWYKFDRDVWMFDTVERTSEALLGLTMRCCRCHDHKFDPVSQVEYYRFRAFFEPHDVRTDPISATTTTENDSTLGAILKEGVALVYDKDQAVPTYRFERGDSRFPDKTQPLEPGVPAALAGAEIAVRPIDLPTAVWYPMLRPELQASLREQSLEKVAIATQKREQAQSLVEQTRATLAAAQAAAANSPELVEDRASKPFLHDDFQKLDTERWDIASGKWSIEDGNLVHREIGNFSTIVSKAELPRDFTVRLVYKTLHAGSFRSVGFSFDYQDAGNSQDVYTSVNDSQPSVQAFHRVGGQQEYPPAGIVPTALQVDCPITIVATVRGDYLNVDLDGARKLDYPLPIARRDGRFAIWVHAGAAEFLELEIRELPESLASLQAKCSESDQNAWLAQAELEIALAEQHSTHTRIAAEVAKYIDRDEAQVVTAARLAVLAERTASRLRAEVEVAKRFVKESAPAVSASLPGWSDTQFARFHEQLAMLVALARAAASAEAKSQSLSEALREALKKLAELCVAQEAVLGDAPAIPPEAYTPLGTMYPRTSTGRRLALADWIASKNNIRTARVAVNHLWGRHFGQPLVATPENFGLNGRQPSHPLLLDWLASRLMADDWQMKPLHRLIVLSSTYRMASAADEHPGLAVDPTNQYLWRMNTRRMEAEVVRDSTLHLASQLDTAFGGAELLETSGETETRRSLYFRNTPNEKMPMLEVFDIADPNACYRRKESVVPHQSLAMMNSGLALDHSKLIAMQLSAEPDAQSDVEFTNAAFETILARLPQPGEQARCLQFLVEHAAFAATDDEPRFSKGGSAMRPAAEKPAARARENLVHVLLLHNDFVTVR